MKIYKKFLLYFLLPLLASLLFVFWFIIYSPTEDFLQEQTDEKLLLIAGTLDSEISEKIDDIAREITVMGNYKEFDEYYTYLEFRQVDLADRELSSVLDNFVKFGALRREYTGIRFYDAEGTALINVIDRTRSYKTVDVSDAEWFKESLKIKEGESYVSEVYTSPEYPDPMLTISQPVYNNGELKGVIGIDSMVEDLFSDLLSEKSIGESGHAYLVGPSGRVLAHNYSTPVNEDVSYLHSTKRIFEGYRGIITEESDETPRVMMRRVYTPLMSANIGLVVEIPLHEVLAPVIKMRNTVLPVLLIGLALFTGAGFLLVNRITAPIERLTGISSSMSAGNLDVKADITSDDEIGELSSAFNQMAEDLKEAHMSLEEYAKALEAKVEERTMELQKAYEELRRTNELKDLFTDILRHDLLNPIGIIGNIEEIMEDDKNLKDSTELQVIKRNVNKLKDLVRNASDFAKFDSVEKMEKVDLDLAEVIKSTIFGLEPYALDKKMKIMFKPDGEYRAYAGPEIESVFVNLLSNSIKYSPEGTEIKIAIEDLKKNWKISVSDRGEGIRDEYKAGIFDRFLRRDKSGVKGSGLGLAIVKRLVEMHKGRVWVEDNPLGGSIFYVEMPK